MLICSDTSMLVNFDFAHRLFRFLKENVSTLLSVVIILKAEKESGWVDVLNVKMSLNIDL